mmetsp:Transcript_94302/g.147376  ORF Transcript_94302/g.147376 Transcript_94302/m.147376 type:complete len:338 (-) Transcript_94302:27-1040(-)
MDGGAFEWTDSIDLDGIASLSLEDQASFASSSSILAHPRQQAVGGRHASEFSTFPPSELAAFAALHRSKKGGDSSSSEKPLSYTERLQRLRGSGGPPSAIDVVRMEVRGSGSALQRSIDLSEIIHASKSFQHHLSPSLSSMFDIGGSRDSSKMPPAVSSQMQDTFADDSANTSLQHPGDDIAEVRFRSTSRERVSPRPWPHGIRPSHFAAEAVSRIEFYSRPQISKSSSATLFSDSDSAFRRLRTEDAWADQRRLNVERQSSVPRVETITAARSSSFVPPVEKDSRFRFGDSSIWRVGINRSKYDADAVELVGVGAHVHPLFKPTFRPTPRRINVGA